MANTVDIILKGVDQASGTIANVNRELDGLAAKPGSITTSFAGLGKVIGALGLGALAVQAGGAIIDLGKMGEESAQLDAKFQAVAGGADEARNRFKAMDDAVGAWLTRDEKMAASTRIMSLGLADSAEEAAALAKTAITLGDSEQTAAQRIETFTQMLATGQTRGLAAYGIGVIGVRERVDELKKANDDMSSEMATQQAILEASASRMADLGDYMPITQTQEMANAVADMKDSLGDLVAQPYIISVKFLTEGVENIISLLNRTSNDPAQQLQGYEQQLKNAKDELEARKAATGKGILGGVFNQKASEEELAAYQKIIDDIQAKVDYMTKSQTTSGDVGVAALDKQSNAAILLKDNLQAVEDKYLAVEEKTKAATDPGRAKIDAAGAVANLQKGLFGPEVIGAIDTDALAAEPGMAGLARKSFEAFGKALAANKGSGTNVAELLIGFEKNDKGISTADTAAAQAVNTLASAISAQVTGKDFAGKMIGYGETIWGYTEEGMINKAKSSGAFQAAIDSMVAAAIAGALQ